MMKFIFLFVSLIYFSASSCKAAENESHKTRNISETQHYAKDGLSFSYPSNWRITKDEVYRELGRFVSVADAKDGVFMISLFPAEIPLELGEYADEMKSEWESKAKDVQTSEIAASVLLEPTKGIRHRFLFADTAHTQDIFLVRRSKKIAVLAIQNTDKNWEATNSQFQIILDSLKFD